MHTVGRLIKIVGWLAGIVLGIVALGLVAAVIVYPFEYVRRVLVWRESDVNDYLVNFPGRPLEPAPAAFRFSAAPDEARIVEAFQAILGVEDFDAFQRGAGTTAFIVVKDDAVVFERYYNGIQRDSLVTSFSVAKSFTTALVGAAVAEGHIASVDDPITAYLPELAERDARFGDITVRHVMSMASGLDYQEFRPALFNSDDILTTYYPDQRRAALAFTQIVAPPGEYFLYNKYHPQLLGLILERTTGTPVTAYLQEKIWDPLGMEFGGSWSLDSEESGFEKMEAGLNARAIDFAKFGRLYLLNGNWDGQQVLPAQWVADSTRVDDATLNASYYQHAPRLYNELRGYYGYMWWGFRRDGAQADYAARGDHGQIIYVSPARNLIIVRNGTSWGFSGDDGAAGVKWIRTFFEFATVY